MRRLAALILILAFVLAAVACSSSPAAPSSQGAGEVVTDDGGEVETAGVTTPAGPGKFVATDKMVDARGYHAAVKLADGRVMAIAGKSRGGASAWKPSSIEATAIYDPSTEKWTDSALLSTVREHPTGHLLGDGRIIVIGGSAVRQEPLASVEVYDAAADSWTEVAPMSAQRWRTRLGGSRGREGAGGRWRRAGSRAGG